MTNRAMGALSAAARKKTPLGELAPLLRLLTWATPGLGRES